MWSDDFIEVECFAYSQQESDLFNKNPDECTLISIKRYLHPLLIESFNESIPASDFHEGNKVWTDVTMRSGDQFIVNMTINDFKSKYDAYFNSLKNPTQTVL